MKKFIPFCMLLGSIVYADGWKLDTNLGLKYDIKNNGVSVPHNTTLSYENKIDGHYITGSFKYTIDDLLKIKKIEDQLTDTVFEAKYETPDLGKGISLSGTYKMNIYNENKERFYNNGYNHFILGLNQSGKNHYFRIDFRYGNKKLIYPRFVYLSSQIRYTINNNWKVSAFLLGGLNNRLLQYDAYPRFQSDKYITYRKNVSILKELPMFLRTEEKVEYNSKILDALLQFELEYHYINGSNLKFVDIQQDHYHVLTSNYSGTINVKPIQGLSIKTTLSGRTAYSDRNLVVGYTKTKALTRKYQDLYGIDRFTIRTAVAENDLFFTKENIKILYTELKLDTNISYTYRKNDFEIIPSFNITVAGVPKITASSKNDFYLYDIANKQLSTLTQDEFNKRTNIKFTSNYGNQILTMQHLTYKYNKYDVFTKTSAGAIEITTKLKLDINYNIIKNLKFNSNISIGGYANSQDWSKYKVPFALGTGITYNW